MINRPCNNILPRTFLVLICIAIIAGCACIENQGKGEADALAQNFQAQIGDAKILQSRQGITGIKSGDKNIPIKIDC